MQEANRLELSVSQDEINSGFAMLAQQNTSKPTNATGAIVGNIVKGSPVFPQVAAFAKTHGVPTTKVVITGERMTIKR